MSVDIGTVKRVSHLARLALSEEEAHRMHQEINAMLGLISQLDDLDVTHVESFSSLSSVEPLRMREDIVNDGNIAQEILANAPLSEENFFLVPKVVE